MQLLVSLSSNPHHWIYYNIHLYIKVAKDAMIKLSLHHGLFYWTHNFNRNCNFISYIEIAIVRILNLRRMTCRMLQIFFQFFCMSLGDVQKQWQVRLPESHRHPHPTPHRTQCRPAVYELVWRHGIMGRSRLQRKRTDRLTTHRKKM